MSLTLLYMNLSNPLASWHSIQFEMRNAYALELLTIESKFNRSIQRKSTSFIQKTQKIHLQWKWKYRDINKRKINRRKSFELIIFDIQIEHTLNVVLAWCIISNKFCTSTFIYSIQICITRIKWISSEWILNYVCSFSVFSWMKKNENTLSCAMAKTKERVTIFVFISLNRGSQ